MFHPEPTLYDALIVGAGISGSFIAQDLCRSGLRCLMIEAGRHYARRAYPDNDLDGTAQLYWSGGVELDDQARLVFLRPKVVGGGSVVNQALVDRFDSEALDSWRAVSGVDFFAPSAMAPWYAKAEAEIAIREIPAAFRNANAEIFAEGFTRLGYRLAPLRRAQDDCRFEAGNCCIQCLNGCRIGSKQSTPETVLKRALEAGLVLVPETEALQIVQRRERIEVLARDQRGGRVQYRGRCLVLAAGAVGNTRLLLRSGFGRRLPALGRHFYCHPQYMHFGVYARPIRAHLGPLQAFKSDDPEFRRQGFKLENVYAGPGAIALLVSGFGRGHQQFMERLAHLACIEVCTRDTAPGRIRLDGRGRPVIHKPRSEEDLARMRRGTAVIDAIFQATGARQIVHGTYGIGLHLMGGCRMGTDGDASVVAPDFCLHDHPRIFAADSSIFPDAPGINPSLTIMALSKMAAETITRNLCP
jgi:choline dehydrogenase-like flavoprotein